MPAILSSEVIFENVDFGFERILSAGVRGYAFSVLYSGLLTPKLRLPNHAYTFCNIPPGIMMCIEFETTKQPPYHTSHYQYFLNPSTASSMLTPPYSHRLTHLPRFQDHLPQFLHMAQERTTPTLHRIDSPVLLLHLRNHSLRDSYPWVFRAGHTRHRHIEFPATIPHHRAIHICNLRLESQHPTRSLLGGKITVEKCCGVGGSKYGTLQ